MTQRLKVVPSSVAYDIAGDYFQALRHIIVDLTDNPIRQKMPVSKRYRYWISDRRTPTTVHNNIQGPRPHFSSYAWLTG